MLGTRYFFIGLQLSYTNLSIIHPIGLRINEPPITADHKVLDVFHLWLIKDYTWKNYLIFHSLHDTNLDTMLDGLELMEAVSHVVDHDSFVQGELEKFEPLSQMHTRKRLSFIVGKGFVEQLINLAFNKPIWSNTFIRYR